MGIARTGNRSQSIAMRVALAVFAASLLAAPAQCAFAEQLGTGETDVYVQMPASWEDIGDADSSLPNSAGPGAKGPQVASPRDAAFRASSADPLPRTGDAVGLLVVALAACSALVLLAVGAIAYMRKRV